MFSSSAVCVCVCACSPFAARLGIVGTGSAGGGGSLAPDFAQGLMSRNTSLRAYGAIKQEANEKPDLLRPVLWSPVGL